MTVRRVVIFFLLWAASATVVGDEVAEPLSRIVDIGKVGPEQVAVHPKFSLEATVYSYHRNWRAAFLEQDGHFFACEIGACSHLESKLTPGVLIRAEGYLKPGLLKPIGVFSAFEVIGSNELREPTEVDFDKLQQGEHDCDWVLVNAVVDAVSVSRAHTEFVCHQGDTRFVISMAAALSRDVATAYVDATIRAVGNVTPWVRDEKIIGFNLFCQPERIEIAAAAENPLNVPVELPVTQLWDDKEAHEFLLHGQITWSDPGRGFIVESTDAGTWVDTPQGLVPQVGEQFEIVGRRDPRSRRLRAGVIRMEGRSPLVAPKQFTAEQILRDRPESCRVQFEGTFKGASGLIQRLSFSTCELASYPTRFGLWPIRDSSTRWTCVRPMRLSRPEPCPFMVPMRDVFESW